MASPGSSRTWDELGDHAVASLLSLSSAFPQSSLSGDWPPTAEYVGGPANAPGEPLSAISSAISGQVWKRGKMTWRKEKGRDQFLHREHLQKTERFFSTPEGAPQVRKA